MSSTVRARPERRRDSKLARFVIDYGVKNLASRLGVEPSAVYHWLRGANSFYLPTAFRIQAIAEEAGVALSLHDMYLHFGEAQSERYAASHKGQFS